MKTFRDWFHFDDGHTNVEVATKRGDCEECGATKGQRFYCNKGPVGPRLLCEACARAFCGVQQRREGEPLNVGSAVTD